MKLSDWTCARPYNRGRVKIRKPGCRGASCLTFGLRLDGPFWQGGWISMDGFRSLYFFGIEQ